MINLVCEPGSHSFYGRFSFTVVRGSPTLLGASLFQGFSSSLIVPFTQLPSMFESPNDFELSIIPILDYVETPVEHQFYNASGFADFTEICEKVFYSKTFKGATFLSNALEFADQLLSGFPRKVFITGPQSVGKSTYSVFLVNQLVSQGKRVFLVDVDVGQPIIGFPNSICFAEISSFLLCNYDPIPKKFFSFHGSTSVGNDPKFFLSRYAFLISHLPKNVYIIINSFGWVESLGLRIHQELFQITKPDFILHLYTEEISQVSPDQLPIQMETHQPPLSQMRKLQRIFRIEKQIKLENPILIKFNELYYLPSRCQILTEDEVKYKLYSSVVALGIVDPREGCVLERNVHFICAGFGFVCGYDSDCNSFTMFSEISRKNFNAICFGDVEVPQSFKIKAHELRPVKKNISVELPNKHAIKIEIAQETPLNETDFQFLQDF